MADIKSLAEKRGTLLFFDPRKLQIRAGLNARDITTDDNQQHISWLADDISRHGVKQPLVVFQDGDVVFVADGHCRLTATLLAIERGFDIQTVPCIVEPRGTNDVDRVLSQIIYNSGKRLTPYEQGVNFRKALDLGSTVKEISEKVGLSTSYINQQIAFLAAPQEVHTLVKSGAVSPSLAAKVIRKQGKTAGAEALKAAVETANKAGAKKATAKNLPVTDVLWTRVRAWVVKHERRPVDVQDRDIREALELLGWCTRGD